VADDVSRWLDWTEQNRTIWLATIAHGEDIADPDIRQAVAELVRRAVALLTTFHADIADDTPRLRYALECWTALNRAATRRWLFGEATRQATTNCSPRRSNTSYAPSAPHPSQTGAQLLPDRRTIEVDAGSGAAASA
jgi:hypothetical protein